MDRELQTKLSGWMNVVQLVAVLVTFVALDKMGRRFWLLFGAVGMTLSHLTVACMIGELDALISRWNALIPLLLSAKFSSDWASHPTGAYTGVLSIFLFMAFYGVSFGPMGWILPAEVHSSTYRGKGVGLATSTNWTCNTIVGLITPPLVQKTGYGAFAFFAVWAAASGVWSWFFVPETKSVLILTKARREKS